MSSSSSSSSSDSDDSDDDESLLDLLFPNTGVVDPGLEALKEENDSRSCGTVPIFSLSLQEVLSVASFLTCPVMEDRL